MMQGIEVIAKTAEGLEQVLCTELAELGATVTQTAKRAVHFLADREMLYKANLHLRTAFRIMMPVNSFAANNPDELYRQAFNTPWENYFGIQHTFAVAFTVNSTLFTHSQYAALKLKDAIADRFRKQFNGKRPSVDTRNPHFLVQLHISGNRCNLLLDSSGESLHKRGYRSEQLRAPLNEVLSAGLVLLSGWQGNCTLLDPMCGSGTIAIEAALLQRKIAPGLFRNQFAFEQWKDFDANLWKRLKTDALKKSLSAAEAKVYGADLQELAVRAARENAQNAGLPDINFFKADFIEDKKIIKERQGLIIMNPPYGERLAPADINRFYKSIGDKLKKTYPGFTAWILSSNKEALKHIGLHPSKKHTLYNGPLECRFLEYRLYDGQG